MRYHFDFYQHFVPKGTKKDECFFALFVHYVNYWMAIKKIKNEK